MVTAALRYLSFLSVARCVRARDYLIVAGFIVVAVLGRAYTGIPTPELVPTYLVLVPILAGTGILDAARDGRFDLLFASGATRRRVWAVSAAHSLVLHVVVVLLLTQLILPDSRDVPVLAFAVIALGNAALGFAGGIVRPAAGFGIVWFALRVAFALLPLGAALRTHVLAVNEGQAVPVVWKLFITTLFLPESTLTKPHLPLYVPVMYLLLGAAAMYLSFYGFTRASFTGRRRE